MPKKVPKKKKMYIKQICAKCLLRDCKYSKSSRISEGKRFLPVGVIVEDCVKEIALGLTLKNELAFQ